MAVENCRRRRGVSKSRTRATHALCAEHAYRSGADDLPRAPVIGSHGGEQDPEKDLDKLGIATAAEGKDPTFTVHTDEIQANGDQRQRHG